MVLAQLAEWSLQTIEVLRFKSSHSKIYIEHLFKTTVLIRRKQSKKSPEIVHFLYLMTDVWFKTVDNSTTQIETYQVKGVLLPECKIKLSD